MAHPRFGTGFVYLAAAAVTGVCCVGSVFGEAMPACWKAGTPNLFCGSAAPRDCPNPDGSSHSCADLHGNPPRFLKTVRTINTCGDSGQFSTDTSAPYYCNITVRSCTAGTGLELDPTTGCYVGAMTASVGTDIVPWGNSCTSPPCPPPTKTAPGPVGDDPVEGEP
jgi:hypothetical protein